MISISNTIRRPLQTMSATAQRSSAPRWSSNDTDGSRAPKHSRNTPQNGAKQYSGSNPQDSPKQAQYLAQQKAKEKTKMFNMKNACKDEILAYNSVSDLDEDNVRDIISRVSVKTGMTSSADFLVIHTTVLGIILSCVPALENGQIDVINKLTPLIIEITNPTHETTGRYNITHTTKTVNGYNLINSIYWIKGGYVASKESYLDAVVQLIKVCGCDILAKNNKGETALESYMESVRKGSAPLYDEMIEILSNTYQKDKILRMIMDVINKANLGNVNTLANNVKYVYCLEMDMFVTQLIMGLTSINSFKQGGRYGYVSNTMGVYRQMFYKSIAKDDKYEILCSKFGNPDAEYHKFLNCIINKCVERLYDTNINNTDVFGALIAECYRLTKNCDGYRNYLQNVIKAAVSDNTDVNQNILMTSMTHMISTTMTYAENAMFFPKNIMTMIADAFKNKNLHMRIGYQLQDAFNVITKNGTSYLNLDKVFNYIETDVDVQEVDVFNPPNDSDTEMFESMIDLDSWSHLTPKFIKFVDNFDNNDTVVDWITYRKAEVANEDTNTQLKKIVNLIIGTLNDVFIRGMDDKLDGFMNMMNNVYGDNVVKMALKMFQVDDMSADDVYDSPIGRALFARVMSSYSL